MPDDDIDRSQTVTIAFVHEDEVSFSFHQSMMNLVGWDMANNAHVIPSEPIVLEGGTDGLVQARNLAIKTFLDKRDADWLFWIDTDMGFAPDTVDRLLEVADPVERPVVGALCFSMRKTDHDGLSGRRSLPTPTVFDWAKVGEKTGFAVRWNYAPDAVTQVAGSGSACILIHRSVFERVAEKYGPIWYDRVPNTQTGQLISEDLSFCLRAGSLGIPMWVHTGVKTNHLKPIWVQELDYLHTSAPPATEETAVIVPVLNRPQNAEPFMTTLKATTGLAKVYAVVEPTDDETAKAWHAAGARVIWGHDELDQYQAGQTEGVAHSFAEKVNLAYRQTADLDNEPWLFIVGDDVKFRPGWLDHAQAMARTGAKVIGVNDLGNPRTLDGEHAAHLLISRDYVDEVGASWDGPGVVCHEGYRHWFVDDEVVTAAKQRGVWQMAMGAVVEHMHPIFGKADDDPVYALGQSFAAGDAETFARRLEANRDDAA